MKNKPYIHLFRCSTGYYLYDVNTDCILKVSEETFQILERRKGENDQIRKLISAGYLKENHVEISEHPMTPYLESFYKKHLSAISLQVTQSCNLRCDYCVYSGKYSNRTHSNKKMSFEMAKKGIDYLLEHSAESPTISVGFYGGEPLLEFPLIQRCVEYVEKNDIERDKKFLITTNATLLTPTVIDFLVSHNFNITISFDGPKEIHDKYRRFAGNNRGSYDVVMENVKYIKKKYNAFFKDNVQFNTVLSPTESYQCIGEFLQGDEVLKDSIFISSIVSDIGVKDKSTTEVTELFAEEYNYEYFKVLMAKLGKIQEKNVSIIARGLFQTLGMMRGGKQRISNSELPRKWHHSGPCIPGKRTIFINADGNFYPCEKVCEKADLAIMGNVDEGINISKAKKILNIEKYTGTECRSCWAYRHCSFCIRYAEPDENKLRENVLNRCAGMRKSVENTFKDYCIMRELGYDFECDCIKRKGEKDV